MYGEQLANDETVEYNKLRIAVLIDPSAIGKCSFKSFFVASRTHKDAKGICHPHLVGARYHCGKQRSSIL